MNEICTTSLFTGLSCPRDTGWCVQKDGLDQNYGEKYILKDNADTPKGQEECFKQCRAVAGATGCEAVWDKRFRGCVIHTAPVDRGSRLSDQHVCWVFSKCVEGNKYKLYTIDLIYDA